MSPIESMNSLIARGGYALPDALYRAIGTPPPTKHFSVLRKNLRTERPSSAEDYEYVMPELTPISTQGSSSTCVANAQCDALEYLLGFEHGRSSVVQLSRRFLYWVARYTHGMTSMDAGTYPRAGAWQLQVCGVPREEHFPFSTREDALIVSPPLDVYSMASENRVTGHYRITTEGMLRSRDIWDAVTAQHPVQLATHVNEDFIKYDGGGHVLQPPRTTKHTARHAMLVVGVRQRSGDREFLLRNSWGAGWGDGGYAWVSNEYITASYTGDIWVFTRMQRID